MGEKKMDEEKKKAKGGKKEGGASTVVLKIDLHCYGCAEKIFKLIKRFEGVEKVTGDMTTNNVTVMGKVDPMKLKDCLESKKKKKVELISPQPKKYKEGGGGDKKSEEKSEKKNKEPTVTTVVLKTRFHCQGCIEKMQKTIDKIKGVEEFKIDAQKDTVTVKGTMDVKSLQSYLKDKLKKTVDVVPPKKDAGGGEKKDKGSGGGGGDGGGEKKEKGSGGGENKEGGEESTENKVEYHGPMYYGLLIKSRFALLYENMEDLFE